MNAFCKSIHEVIATTDNAPLLVHSDVFRSRAAISISRDPRVNSCRHIEALEVIADGRPLWFPAFNYDYLRSGLYQPQSDVSQVGHLTEYARTKWAAWRCGPPVFNFSGRSERPAGVCEAGDVDPFGDCSMFALLHRCSGNILMYGAGFSAFTAIHYVERKAGGPLYRFDKVFPGSVRVHGADDQEVRLNYHCQPRDKAVTYDWSRLRCEAEAQGVLSVVTAPGSEAVYVRFPDLCRYWLEKLQKDPLYLLDEESKRWVAQALETLGRRFLVTDFE